MYTIDNSIASQKFDNLQVQKLVKNETLDILNISLEKDAIFPEHISSKDAQLIVLGGTIVFHINGEFFKLKRQQHFSFPKNEKHWVIAKESSNFLIIR